MCGSAKRPDAGTKLQCPAHHGNTQRHFGKSGKTTGKLHRIHLRLRRGSTAERPHQPASKAAHHQRTAGTGLPRPACGILHQRKAHRAAQARNAQEEGTPPIHHQRLRHRAGVGRDPHRRQRHRRPICHRHLDQHLRSLLADPPRRRGQLDVFLPGLPAATEPLCSDTRYSHQHTAGRQRRAAGSSHHLTTQRSRHPVCQHGFARHPHHTDTPHALHPRRSRRAENPATDAGRTGWYGGICRHVCAWRYARPELGNAGRHPRLQRRPPDGCLLGIHSRSR